MKCTGIVRRVDDLGRVVIPMELRKTMDIKEGDPLEIFVDGDRIIFRKYQPGCMICDSVDIDIVIDGKKQLCKSCGELIVEAHQEKRNSVGR